MGLPKLGRSRTIALVALTAGLGAGAIAYASIPDSTGVIHGCYANKDGSLRVINTGAAQSCDSKKETALNWSQTGPMGPTGAKGATGANGAKGATGPKGDAGPSAAYTDYEPNATISSGNTATVASVTLPAGTYTLLGSVDVFPVDSGSGDPTFGSCQFVSAGTVHGFEALATVEGDIGETMPVLGDVTITIDDTAVFMRCNAVFSDTHFFRPELIATRVGSVTPSQ